MSYWIEVEPTGRVRSITQALGETAPMPLVSGNTLHLVEQRVDPRRAAWFNDELVDIGEAPSTNHVYDWGMRAWTDPRDLDWFKEAKWTEIKAQRDAIEFGTFTYDGNVFDGDVDAQRRLNVLISVSKSALAVGATFTVTFVLADNSTVELEPPISSPSSRSR
jgi:hypothetical protein